MIHFRLHIFVLSLLILSCSGCSTDKIKLCGKSTAPQNQHGLKVSLDLSGTDKLRIEILNSTNKDITLSKNRTATIYSNGKLVTPKSYMMIKIDTTIDADSFITIASGQKASLEQVISMEENEFEILGSKYEFKHGQTYELQLTIQPYFLRFQPETAKEYLQKLKLPNYLNSKLITNKLEFRLE